jgi:hypothetical protein
MKSSILAIMLLALPFQVQSIDLSGIAYPTADYLQSFKKKEKEDKCQQIKNDLLLATLKIHRSIYHAEIFYTLRESLKECEESQKKA